MARNQAIDLAYAAALVPHVKGHEQKSPFPIHFHCGSFIVDEMCRCGKPRSQHEDTLQYGHGPGMDGVCPKFTWAAFVESAWPPARSKKAKPVTIVVAKTRSKK